MTKDIYRWPRRAVAPFSGGRHVATVAYLTRWIVLGVVSGLLAGLSSYAFLRSLTLVTRFRLDTPEIVWALPVVGLLIGFVYHRWGGRSSGGNSMLLAEIHERSEWVPRRLAPLVFVGTVLAHLFGASVGREGTAIQMSGSLTDFVSRLLHLDDEDRRIMLMTAIGGGFGAVFGVPLAGAVFALEVQSLGRLRYEGLVPALSASVVGDMVVRGLGYHHTVTPQLAVSLEPLLLLKVFVASLAFGLTSSCFSAGTHLVARAVPRLAVWPPVRPVVGGVATLGLMAVLGREYLGLSLPLIDAALAGDHVGIWVFAVKLLFTVIALGCAFPGGEVTPLFVIGATLGAALAPVLGVDPTLLAAVGYVAVFGGASNTPLACTVMGVELFGSSSVVFMALGCVVAYVCSTHRGIYSTQHVDTDKLGHVVNEEPTVSEWTMQRMQSEGASSDEDRSRP